MIPVTKQLQYPHPICLDWVKTPMNMIHETVDVVPTTTKAVWNTHAKQLEIKFILSYFLLQIYFWT